MGLIAHIPCLTSTSVETIQNCQTSGTVVTSTADAAAPFGNYANYNTVRTNYSPKFPNKCKKVSLAFWVKPTYSGAAWADVIAILGVLEGSSSNVHFRLEWTGGEYRWYGNGGITNDGGFSGFNSSQIPSGTWGHIAITLEIDGSTAHFQEYINGSLVYDEKQTQLATSSSWKSAYFGGSNSFHIGDTGTITFGISDVRLYDEILSAYDVKELQKKLMVHYAFDREVPVNEFKTLVGNSIGSGGSVSYTNGIFKLTSTTTSSATDHGLWLYITNANSYLAASTSYVFCAEVFNTSTTADVRVHFESGAYIVDSNYKSGSYAICTEKNKWVKIWVTFVTSATSNSTSHIMFYPNPYDGSFRDGYQLFRNIQIYKGSSYIEDAICSSKIIDVNTMGMDGTMYNYTASNNARIGLGAGNFNGSNTYVAVPQKAKLTGPMSYNVWAYMSNWANFNSGNMRIVSCTESGGWNIEPVSSKVAFALYDGGAGGYKSFTSSILWSDLTAGWHMFTCTFDGSNGRFYLDGSLLGTSATFANAPNGRIGYNSSNTILIGAEAQGNLTPLSGYYFNGQIDDFRIYSSALSQEDITNLYKKRASIDNSGKVHISQAKSNGVRLVDVLNGPTTFYNQAGAGTDLVYGDICVFNAGSNPHIEQPSVFSMPVANHKYYGFLMWKSMSGFTVSDCRFEWYLADAANSNMVFASKNYDTGGTWVRLSSIQSLASPVSGTWKLRNFLVSSTQAAYCTYPRIIDLTATFGEGNEPSVEWCDANISIDTAEVPNPTNNDFNISSNGVLSLPCYSEFGRRMRYLKVSCNGSTANAYHHIQWLKFEDVYGASYDVVTTYKTSGGRRVWFPIITGSVQETSTDCSQTIIFDLGKEYIVKSVSMARYYSDGRQYYQQQVAGSLDNSTYFSIYNSANTGSNGSGDSFNLYKETSLGQKWMVPAVGASLAGRMKSGCKQLKYLYTYFPQWYIDEANKNSIVIQPYDPNEDLVNMPCAVLTNRFIEYNYTVSIKMSVHDLTAPHTLFCACTSEITANSFSAVYVPGTGIISYYGNQSAVINVHPGVDEVFEYTHAADKIYYNGSLVYTYSQVDISIQPPFSCLSLITGYGFMTSLNSRSIAPGPGTGGGGVIVIPTYNAPGNRARGIFYNCKIWNSTRQLIADYVACIQGDFPTPGLISASRWGVYDLCSDSFLEPEYLTSGSSFIGENPGNTTVYGPPAHSSYLVSKELCEDYPSYTLKTSIGSNTSLSIQRVASEHRKGISKVLKAGDTIYAGDDLLITASASSGYKLNTFTVNGSTFTSGNRVHVNGPVTIATTAVQLESWKTVWTGSLDIGYKSSLSPSATGFYTISTNKTINGLQANKPTRITFSSYLYRVIGSGSTNEYTSPINTTVLNATGGYYKMISTSGTDPMLIVDSQSTGYSPSGEVMNGLLFDTPTSANTLPIRYLYYAMVMTGFVTAYSYAICYSCVITKIEQYY